MRFATVALIAIIGFAGTAIAAVPMRFWNLTSDTITSFQLAAPGTTDWGPNQTDNDPDGSVDPDERLNITGVAPGMYDAKFTDVKGRTCVVKNVKIDKPTAIFSIEEPDVDPKLCLTK